MEIAQCRLATSGYLRIINVHRNTSKAPRKQTFTPSTHHSLRHVGILLARLEIDATLRILYVNINCPRRAHCCTHRCTHHDTHDDDALSINTSPLLLLLDASPTTRKGRVTRRKAKGRPAQADGKGHSHDHALHTRPGALRHKHQPRRGQRWPRHHIQDDAINSANGGRLQHDRRAASRGRCANTLAQNAHTSIGCIEKSAHDQRQCCTVSCAVPCGRSIHGGQQWLW